MKQKMVIYQVLPRIFGNDNVTRKPNGTRAENGCGKFSAFTPNALQAIAELGATHVWYTGILEHATATDAEDKSVEWASVVKGLAGSPYAVSDYYDVAADLADNVVNRMEEFEALVERTHQAHLGVIIDFVPNHVARVYHSDTKPQGVSDFGDSDRKDWYFSPQNNFYYFPNDAFSPQFDAKSYVEIPAKATGNNCFSPSPSSNDWYETVKLNYGVDYMGGASKHFDPIPDTWLKMRDILLFWAGKGIDGFRCDMAEMVPVEFWQWVICQIKSKFPNLVFIAEVYDPSRYRSYIFDGGFDFLYDKVGLYDTLRGVVNGTHSAAAITTAWQNVNDIQEKMLSFLENHDEQRIASDFFAGDARLALPAMMVVTLLTTSPVMCYFGQELGERGMDAEGFSGCDGRTTIFDYWSLDKIIRWRNADRYDTKYLTTDEIELQTFYRKIFTLAHEKVVTQGTMYDLQYLNLENPNFNASKQFAWLRRNGKDTLLIVANFTHESTTISLNITKEVFDFLGMHISKRQVVVDVLSDRKQTICLSFETLLSIELPAHNGVIFKFKN